ncbi:hypothetical protein PO909_027286 [Leuciscus waleckii]
MKTLSGILGGKGQLDGALKQQWVARVLRHRWHQSAALGPHGHSGMLPMQTCKLKQMKPAYACPGTTVRGRTKWSTSVGRSSLPYFFPTLEKKEDALHSLTRFGLGVALRRCVFHRCLTLNIPLCSSQLCEQWVLIENLGDERSTVTPLNISKDLRIWQL